MQENAITSLFDYLEGKNEEMKRMSEAEGCDFEEGLHNRSPREETAEDWSKIEAGMNTKEAARERGISYSQIRKRLKQFGYK